MRIAALIARYLLGLIFLVFGLNGFLHFIPMQPVPPVAGQFFGALFTSHVLVIVLLLELIGAILLLANRYVPLGLVVLGPVIVNIFLFHLFMAPSLLPLAILVVILWLLVAWSVRPAFAGIFQQKT